MFYFIQLIHDKGKDMYIVTTQFGRIGDEGENQRSPFNSLEDAKNDFVKFLKAKLGIYGKIEIILKELKGNIC